MKEDYEKKFHEYAAQLQAKLKADNLVIIEKVRRDQESLKK